MLRYRCFERIFANELNSYAANVYLGSWNDCIQLNCMKEQVGNKFVFLKLFFTVKELTVCLFKRSRDCTGSGRWTNREFYLFMEIKLIKTLIKLHLGWLIYSETNRRLVVNFTYAHTKKRGLKACTKQKIVNVSF